jgi:large subunit ribosomal protein L25
VIELHAVRRELDGKRHAQYSRRHGLIPGLVYSAASSKGGFVSGQQGTLKVYVKEADLRREVNRARTSFLNTLVTLVVDGVRHTVLPRDLQLHPFRPKIICCNWYKYTPGKFPGTKVDIPLVAANEERCLAFKEGGWLLQLVHKVSERERGGGGGVLRQLSGASAYT